MVCPCPFINLSVCLSCHLPTCYKNEQQLDSNKASYINRSMKPWDLEVKCWLSFVLVFLMCLLPHRVSNWKTWSLVVITECTIHMREQEVVSMHFLRYKSQKLHFIIVLHGLAIYVTLFFLE